MFCVNTVGIEGEHTETEWKEILDTALKENELMALPVDVYKVYLTVYS